MHIHIHTHRYEHHLGAIIQSLLAGQTPPTAAYQERDYWLLQLDDGALREEYLRHTEAYLDAKTPPALRGMAEMLVIRLGELINKPQHVRKEQAEQLRRGGSADKPSAAQAASRTEERERMANAAAVAAQHTRWNAEAFEQLHAKLAAAVKDPASDPVGFQRLANRQELQLVMMTSREAARLTYAQMQAWGTGGLQPSELRAVLHAVESKGVSGKPAQQFKEQLRAKMVDLPPPTNGVRPQAAASFARM